MRTSALLLVGGVLLTACHRGEKEIQAFNWNGEIPQGGWLHVRDMNGDIEVGPSNSGRVEIVATQRWRGRKPVMSYQANRASDGMYVCAFWTRSGQCDAEGYKSKRRFWERFALLRRRNNAEVDFAIRIPAGVRLDVSTVNGDVTIRGAGAQVIARSVNGDVEAMTYQGGIQAATVNGDASVRMDGMQGAQEVSATTVTGDAIVELPAELGAAVELSTVTGEVSSEFPMVTTSSSQSHGAGRQLRGTIGAGGLRLSATTVTGDVHLRRVGSAASTS